MVKVIYMITYPNGKIYIGQDRTDSANYFGSIDGKLVRHDFSKEELRDFTIRKQILWESEDVSVQDLNKKEIELILKYHSNDPTVGYNRRPVFRQKADGEPAA